MVEITDVDHAMEGIGSGGAHYDNLIIPRSYNNRQILSKNTALARATQNNALFAQEQAQAATESTENSALQAQLAKSYATGNGSGTDSLHPNQTEDNAKRYKELAEAASDSAQSSAENCAQAESLVSEMRGEISAMKDSVTQMTDPQMVDNKINAAIADILDGAPERFDTMKEVADWMEGHETEVEAINADIASRLKKDGSNLEAGDTEINIDAPDADIVMLPASGNLVKRPISRLWDWIKSRLARDFYAECGTAAGTCAKKITLPFETRLIPGMTFNVKFAAGHTAVSSKNGNNVSGGYPTLGITNGRYNGALNTDFPITVEGQLAGENFVNANATHKLFFTGTSFEDMTATVVYKGTNENGDYVKQRDGKYWNDNYFIDFVKSKLHRYYIFNNNSDHHDIKLGYDSRLYIIVDATRFNLY